MARPRKEGVEEEAAAAKEEEEERRGKEGGREGRAQVLLLLEEVRRRLRAVRTQVEWLARVGTRRRAKAGRAAVWRSKEALDANIAALGGEVDCAWVVPLSSVLG